MKLLLFTLSLLLSSLSYGQLAKTNYKKIGETTVYNLPDKEVFLFTGGLMVDADGAPKAYHKDSKLALDYLGNAGKAGNWWALATDNKKRTGQPVIQSSGDPAPGYYVSMTSLQDKTKKYSDPLRYVNASEIPYIAIPSKFSNDFKLGDIALVINKKNNKRCFAIFADIGPANKMGEGSIYLAEQLGIKSNPKNGGASSDVVYILIKNSGKGAVLTKEQIDETGRARLTEADIDEILR